MNDFLIYLLKSAGILVMFFGFYFFLLRKDTDFSANRKFLLAGVITSAVLPAVYFTRTVFIEAQPQTFFLAESGLMALNTVPEETSYSMDQILILIYFVGVLVMLIRFIFQITSLLKILLRGILIKKSGTKYIISSQKIAPFSFLNYIVYNPALHTEAELNLILKHEKVHVNQMHSGDVLISNVNLIYQWFNPIAWIYIKNLQQNLEFIADSEAVKEAPCKKEYQKALVKISVENLSLSLTNNFYQSLIKKRIIMLNKKNSLKSNYWKAGLIIPALLAFLLIFNVKTVAQVKDSTPEAAYAETMDVAATVTKNSVQLDLENISNNFKKQGIILDFINVKRNSEGIITDISVELINSKTSTSASYSKSDPDGIETFKIYSKESGESGFSDSKPAKGHTYYLDTTSVKGNVQVYIASTNEKAGDTIHILNAASARTIYGKAAKNAGVLIATKNGDSISNNGKATKKPAYYTTSYTNISGSPATYVRVTQDTLKKGTKYFITSQPTAYQISADPVTAGTPGSFGGGSKVFYASTQNQNPPLYVVEGKVMGESFDIKDLDHTNIEGITVLKGESAIKVYGEKGKNGVIEITLKDQYSGNNPVGNFAVIKASTTDEGLKITRQKLQEMSNLKLDFKSIKRNKSGLITEIKIIAKTENEEIIGTFSETESINDIYVGVVNNKIYISSNPPKN